MEISTSTLSIFHTTHLWFMYRLLTLHTIYYIFLYFFSYSSQFFISTVNSMHDCENCWGPGLSLDDFYSLKTRERGKIMGIAILNVTQPWPDPGWWWRGQVSSYPWFLRRLNHAEIFSIDKFLRTGRRRDCPGMGSCDIPETKFIFWLKLIINKSRVIILCLLGIYRYTKVIKKLWSNTIKSDCPSHNRER